MDDDRFAFAVDALYGAIDLPAPLATELGPTHTMHVDDVAVTLAQSPNGSALLVSATVGTLPTEEPARTKAAETLLREGFALTGGSVAALTVDGERVRATAMVPDAAGARAEQMGEALKRAVEDVMERVIIHGATLSMPDAPRTADTRDVGAAMIFRP
ncbi:MAG: CesT family type III secretion system chaperone [Pseudomonadota bacterium]